MGASSRSDKRRGKRPRVDDARASSSSSWQHADLPDDTPAADPGGAFSWRPRRLRRARACRRGGGRRRARALERGGRPPRAEAGKEDLFLGILPSDPACFEIMEPIPDADPPPAPTLPPMAMLEALERCLQGHRRPSGEGDAAQGHGDMFGAPSRPRHGQYGCLRETPATS